MNVKQIFSLCIGLGIASALTCLVVVGLSNLDPILIFIILGILVIAGGIVGAIYALKGSNMQPRLLFALISGVAFLLIVIGIAGSVIFIAGEVLTEEEFRLVLLIIGVLLFVIAICGVVILVVRWALKTAFQTTKSVNEAVISQLQASLPIWQNSVPAGGAKVDLHLGQNQTDALSEALSSVDMEALRRGIKQGSLNGRREYNTLEGRRKIVAFGDYDDD